MTEQELTAAPAIALSPYLSLRQAVQPAIFAHRLLAGDAQLAGELAAECEYLLFLTRELLKASGQVHIIAAVSGHELPEASDGTRRAQLLDAYADAGMLWAKVVGSSMVLAGALLDRDAWDDVRGSPDSWPTPGSRVPPPTCVPSSARRSGTGTTRSFSSSAARCRRSGSASPSRHCGHCSPTCRRTSRTGTGRSTGCSSHSPGR